MEILRNSTELISKIPQSVKDLLYKHPYTKLAGGFLRDLRFDKTPNDIDLFGPISDCPFMGMPATKHKNTLIWQPPDLAHPVQWIANNDPISAIITKFDFVINQIYYEPPNKIVLPSSGLYATNVTLTTHLKNSPDVDWKRILRRALKLHNRGYRISINTLSTLLTNIISDTDFDICKHQYKKLFIQSLTDKAEFEESQDINTVTTETLTNLSESGVIPYESNRTPMALNSSTQAGFAVDITPVRTEMGNTTIEWTATTTGIPEPPPTGPGVRDLADQLRSFRETARRIREQAVPRWNPGRELDR